MKTLYLHLYVFFILVGILESIPTSAQVYDRKFNSGIKAANLEFKMPVKFSEKDSSGRKMVCWDNYAPIASIIYTIINQDSTIIIGFYTLSTKAYFDGRTAVENVLNRKSNYQDTTAAKPIIHTSKFAKSAFNADAAVEYSRNCTQTANGYNNMRIVSIANKKFGEGNIVYFYKDKAKPTIDKFIKGNAAMLRFKSYKAR